MNKIRLVTASIAACSFAVLLTGIALGFVDSPSPIASSPKIDDKSVSAAPVVEEWEFTRATRETRCRLGTGS